ncbi:ROK family protein [Candidatus Woesebacteria bacterium]|nr:MAG: ROK family protein [Candidatus Woesebacteria bacterium]
MYIVFDIGGTKMRVAKSDDCIAFDEPIIVDTPENFEEGMRVFADAINGCKSEDTIKLAAGGIAGAFDKSRINLLTSPHLSGWAGKPIHETLTQIVGSRVYFQNDTTMVALGEAHAGAGRGYEIVAYITISTGVGGARIVNGKIDESTYNFEPGHQIIDADATLCPDCGCNSSVDGSGSWESLISGTAVQQRFGKSPKEITDQKIWDEIARLTAYGLNNTIVHWTPDIVVLGGGMMKTPGISVDKVKEELKNILKIYPEHPIIVKAQLGDFGGLHGSLAYLRQIVK